MITTTCPKCGAVYPEDSLAGQRVFEDGFCGCEGHKTDMVNHPSHYQAGGLESIDIIEAFGLGFHAGNAVKYILRAGKKNDRLQDFEKAVWYLNRLIEKEK